MLRFCFGRTRGYGHFLKNKGIEMRALFEKSATKTFIKGEKYIYVILSF